MTNTYAEGNGNLLKFTYANGHSLEFVYDQYDRVTAEKAAAPDREATQTAFYTYNAEGQVARVRNHVNNDTTTYAYDCSD